MRQNINQGALMGRFSCPERGQTSSTSPTPRPCPCRCPCGAPEAILSMKGRVRTRLQSPRILATAIFVLWMDASRFSATIVARRKACHSIYSQLIWVNNRSTSTASTAIGVIISRKISRANNLFIDSVSGARNSLLSGKKTGNSAESQASSQKSARI